MEIATATAPFLELVGASRQLQLLGIPLLGMNAANGRKLLITTVYFVALYALSRALGAVARLVRGREAHRSAFWARQASSLATFVLALLGFVSIWFDNPARLATGAGLVGAGLAFALQKVVSSLAGYFVILRGKTFTIGDRIVMGGVRGDVIALNFMQTVIMEMGEPPSVDASHHTWVQARQFSGRIVTISNAKIFEEPVYNFTRDFPFLWEEVHVPISFNEDRAAVERILLQAARHETVDLASMAAPALDHLKEKYFLGRADLEPKVYVRLTRSYVEMTVRFICRDRDSRALMDRVNREILDALAAANIAIASGTYDVSLLQPAHLAVSLDATASHSA